MSDPALSLVKVQWSWKEPTM